MWHLSQNIPCDLINLVSSPLLWTLLRSLSVCHAELEMFCRRLQLGSWISAILGAVWTLRPFHPHIITQLKWFRSVFALLIFCRQVCNPSLCLCGGGGDWPSRHVPRGALLGWQAAALGSLLLRVAAAECWPPALWHPQLVRTGSFEWHITNPFCLVLRRIKCTP